MGLSGTPGSLLDTGARYDFLPAAYDADGDPLRFTISGKPAWASFDPASGRLSGTPMPGQVGTYADIVITASDGQATTSLPAFQIQVTGTAALSWSAPTQNMDTSALTDLAGYRVYAWKRDGTRLAVDPITDIAEMRRLLGGLSAGTWFFAVTAFNTAGIESDLSNIGSKTIY